MADHTFRIRFRLVDGTVLGEENSEREITSTGAGRYRLRAEPGDRPIKESNWLVLTGPIFAGEKEAQEAGEVAKDALRWWSAREKTGVDVGQDEPIGVFTEEGKAWARTLGHLPPGAPLLNDVHGLCVYQDRPGTRFIAAEAQATLVKSIEGLQDAFREALSRRLRLKGQLTLAFDLYNASHFLAVPPALHSTTLNRARFLTLWTALESLTDFLEEEDRRRNDAAREHLKGLIEQTQDSRLPPDEKDSLIGGLGSLYHEPLRQLCLKLVDRHVSGRQYADTDAGSLVSKCYDRRSSLVHGGALSDDDLSTMCAQLDNLVADLLIEVAQAGSEM